MFNILSDLTLCTRRDFTAANANNDVVASGVSGVWVTLDTNGYLKRTQSAVGLAWPVFNESARDGSIKWTPDVLNTLKFTVLAGKFYARTDQYTSITQIGPLMTGANGKLVAATEGTTTNVVAYCVKPPYTYSYLGNNFTVIDIFVL